MAFCHFFKNPFYFFIFLLFFKKKKEAECFFFPAPSPFLLRIQPSLRHPRGSSVPRTSTHCRFTGQDQVLLRISRKHEA
ncbi:hypothetical protein ES332_A05G447900v1 [Gossypium tomentosum]|uniref:Secreted protein n=1 Tax=Gossypium tomentosum TaxID=34277 RepID=A0A5D2QTC3_GOSTO|nr:hypothetical protein ES332_A05G447900v1 [Gossypium tomentosum]